MTGVLLQPGEQIPPMTMMLTLQRLIMVAGANRDFALSHSDNETARFGGAPAAYADSMLIFALFEKMLLQWTGPSGVIRRFGPLKIRDFVTCGQPVTASGEIECVEDAIDWKGRRCVSVSTRVRLSQENGRIPVEGVATVLVRNRQ